MTAEELAVLQVTWFEGEAKSWSRPGLTIKLPRGPFSGRTKWEAHFFGQKQALPMEGTPFTSGAEIGCWSDKDKLKAVHAVFGKVHIKAAAEIESLRFDRRQGTTMVHRKTASGLAIELAFNQNEIAFRPDQVQVV